MKKKFISTHDLVALKIVHTKISLSASLKMWIFLCLSISGFKIIPRFFWENLSQMIGFKNCYYKHDFLLCYRNRYISWYNSIRLSETETCVAGRVPARHLADQGRDPGRREEVRHPCHVQGGIVVPYHGS